MKQSKAQKLWFIFKSAPSKFVEMLLWGLFSCILSVCSVWSTGRLVSLISGGSSQELLGLVIIYGVLLVLSALYSIYYKRYKVQFKVITEFEQKIRTTLFKKSSKISNETYEDSFTANRIRIADGARQNLFRYVEICISLLMAILQAFAVTAYVSSFNAWFLLLLPFSVIPPCLNLLYQTNLWKRYYKAVEQCKKEETDYLKGLIDDVACKESRLTYASELLAKKWNQSRNQRDSIEKKKSKKLLLLQLPLILVDFVGSYGGYVVAVILLFCGKIDYAACAAAIAAYSSIIGALSSLVSMIGYEGQYSRMIQPFFDYLAVPERSSLEKPVALQEKITLDHVSFKYPSQEKPALEDVCLTIKKGEVVAIVGENGAGKTTLTNILLGLFAPSRGKVLYDGKDVFSASEHELHKRQSVVSQKFNRYKMTVRDNIAIGDFGLHDEKKIVEKYRAFLDGAQVELDTLLGKEFGGRDLSGGQWQKLSCARGFYKNSDFLVLDEATSAIDPLREKAMYDAFRHELDGKTGIIVTHRLGAVSLADRIVVLVHGRVVQEGTHEELLLQEGPYSQLWKVQTRAYEEWPLE